MQYIYYGQCETLQGMKLVQTCQHCQHAIYCPDEQNETFNKILYCRSMTVWTLIFQNIYAAY